MIINCMRIEYRLNILSFYNNNNHNKVTVMAKICIKKRWLVICRVIISKRWGKKNKDSEKLNDDCIIDEQWGAWSQEGLKKKLKKIRYIFFRCASG